MLKLGLPNLGNTCYINSMIQCLRYQKSFVTSIIDIEEETDILRNFIELLYAESDIGDLRGFVRALSTNPQFRLLRQCDAHELYLYLIDSLYEKHKDSENKFQGVLQSTVTCMTCMNTSVTSNPFISLSLECSGNVLEVPTLLNMFQALEELDDKITCDKCKDKKQSTKQLALKKLPEILVVHLKRFNSNLKNNAELKIDENIQLCGKNYLLSATCNHIGGLHGGHYTAACKRENGTWIICNDIQVRSLADIPACNPAPYVLFYRLYEGY
jgi:ubiquitin C-terminal hydrolase